MKTTKNCKVCGIQIPEGRLKALPETEVCTEHSNTAPYIGNIVAIGDPEDDQYQELDIIKDPEVANRLSEYRKQQGNQAKSNNK